MEHYAEFDIATGRIVRRGRCQSQHIPTPRRLSAIALVHADYTCNAIICDEIDSERKAVNPVPTKKSFDVHKPKSIEIPESKKPVTITNEQWQDILKRLQILEAE